MYEEKWNVLIYITKLFCNLTNHYYSIQVLPFTSYAQNILFELAKNATSEKRDVLKQCEEKFIAWKSTNKKKFKTRQAMLEGKTPPEETEYLKHKVT